MSEILFGLVAAVFVAAVLGLAVYRAGQASGREQHRAEAHKVWEARNRGDNRPAREILGKEPENVIAWRARPEKDADAIAEIEVVASRLRTLGTPPTTADFPEIVARQLDAADAERRRAALGRIDRHEGRRK